MIGSRSRTDQWPARGLPVRGAGYEPVDTAVFSRAKCPHHIVAKLSSRFCLHFSLFTKHAKRYGNDNDNDDNRDDSSLKLLFLTRIANAEEVDAIDMTNWRTQTAIVYSLFFYILLSTRFETRETRRTWNAKDDDMQEATKRIRNTLCSIRAGTGGSIHGVLQRPEHLMISIF